MTMTSDTLSGDAGASTLTQDSCILSWPMSEAAMIKNAPWSGTQVAMADPGMLE